MLGVWIQAEILVHGAIGHMMAYIRVVRVMVLYNLYNLTGLNNQASFHLGWVKTCILIFTCILIGCKEQQGSTSIKLKKLEKTVVIASKMDVTNDFFISLYSFLQANDSGLYITPSSIINDSVLYKYPINEVGKCCVELEGTVREGRGPNELLQIYSSTKTINGDTLLFYSPNSAKYLSINNEGIIFEPFNTSGKIINTGYSFAYSKGYLLMPTFNKVFSRDYLLTMMNVNTNVQKKIFKPRVPAGYEPAIRNQIFTMGALPNGFAVSFVGDRKAYIIGFDGQIKHELIFGKSEPIPEPYKITNPRQAPASKPYLTKIEFHNGNLFVLLDNVIWILDYPSYQTKELIKILRDPEEKSAPVIDFSITDETIYVRMGRSDLYSVKVNPNWYK